MGCCIVSNCLVVLLKSFFFFWKIVVRKWKVSKKNSSYFDESNFSSTFTETSSAKHHSVFTNYTSNVTTTTAEKENKKSKTTIRHYSNSCVTCTEELIVFFFCFYFCLICIPCASTLSTVFWVTVPNVFMWHDFGFLGIEEENRFERVNSKKKSWKKKRKQNKGSQVLRFRHFLKNHALILDYSILPINFHFFNKALLFYLIWFEKLFFFGKGYFSSLKNDAEKKIAFCYKSPHCPVVKTTTR